MKTAEEKKESRRAYYKRYYATNKEKALAYQAEHRRKSGTEDKRKINNDCPEPQGIEKQCFSIGDLTKAPVDKFQRQIELILSGRMGMVQ